MSHAAHATPAPERTESGWPKYLRELTSRPGWSVARLARESGVNKSSIFRWMSGKVENVSANSVRAIARTAGDDEDAVILLASNAVNNVATAPVDHIEAWERQMIERIYATPGLDDEQRYTRVLRVRQIAAEQRAIEDDLNRRSA